MVAGLAVVGGVAYAMTRKKGPLNTPDSIQPNHTYKAVVTAPAGTPIATQYTTAQLQAVINQYAPGIATIVSGPSYTSDASGVTASLTAKYLGSKAITTSDPSTATDLNNLRTQLSAKGMTLTITDQG